MHVNLICINQSKNHVHIHNYTYLLSTLTLRTYRTILPNHLLTIHIHILIRMHPYPILFYLYLFLLIYCILVFSLPHLLFSTFATLLKLLLFSPLLFCRNRRRYEYTTNLNRYHSHTTVVNSS